MKKIIILIAGILMVAIGADAVLIDDFNRVNGAVGGDWVGGGNGVWQINSNKLKNSGGDWFPSYLISTNSSAITSITSKTFRVEAVVNASETNDMTGLVWNFADTNNYQFFRFRWGNGLDQLQVGQVVGGTESIVVNRSGVNTEPLFLSESFRFVVYYNKDKAEYTISTLLDSTDAVRNTYSFSNSVFSGVPSTGYSGVFSLFSTLGNTYDNFAVTENYGYLDDFNRDDGEGGAGVGLADWPIAQNGTWNISTNRLKVVGGSADPAFRINTHELSSTDEAWDFTLEAKVNASEVADITGLVWNYQDASNYRFFRFRWGNGQDLLQVGEVVGGVTTIVATQGGLDTLALFTSETIRFVVNYDRDAAEYTVETWYLSTSPRNSHTFSDSVFSGTVTNGNSGVYSLFKTDTGNTFDDFTVLMFPETPIVEIGNVAFEIVSTNAVLSWNSRLGATYGIEARTGLASGSWQPAITNIPGNGGVVQVTNEITEANSFYRVYLAE